MPDHAELSDVEIAAFLAAARAAKLPYAEGNLHINERTRKGYFKCLEMAPGDIRYILLACNEGPRYIAALREARAEKARVQKALSSIRHWEQTTPSPQANDHYRMAADLLDEALKGDQT